MDKSERKKRLEEIGSGEALIGIDSDTINPTLSATRMFEAIHFLRSELALRDEALAKLRLRLGTLGDRDMHALIDEVLLDDMEG